MTLELAITLSAIATISIPFAVRFVWKKNFSPKIIAKNGDAQNAQIGPISGQGAIGIANNGDGAQFQINPTIVNPLPKKYGEKEKRDAAIKIREAFDGFFWVFFGRGEHKGATNNLLNLAQPGSRVFKKDREPTIRKNLEGGKKIFEERLKASLPILENSEMEGALDDLHHKLVAIYLTDPFDITEKLKEETLQEVEKILSGRRA